jgi:hypothetical protein
MGHGFLFLTAYGDAVASGRGQDGDRPDVPVAADSRIYTAPRRACMGNSETARTRRRTRKFAAFDRVSRPACHEPFPRSDWQFRATRCVPITINIQNRDPANRELTGISRPDARNHLTDISIWHLASKQAALPLTSTDGYNPEDLTGTLQQLVFA